MGVAPRRFKTKTRVAIACLLVFVITGMVLYNIPVPYYITQPGSAIALQPIVNVENGDKEEHGSFMLVTVTLLEGNTLLYLYERVSPYADLVPYDLMLGNEETPEAYRNRQLYVMQSSQENAMLASFQVAGLTAKAVNFGVRVLRTIPEMPAADVLQTGDVIRGVEGQEINTQEDLLQAVEGKEPREIVNLTILRGGEQLGVKVGLDYLPPVQESPEQENQVGMGIYSVTNRIVETSRDVHINTKNIGGPSAGLMMALEIYNQLTEGDLTKGYRVVGTGTIDPSGTVGQIGGADHKVVAANAMDADIFFVPADVNAGDTNQTIATKKANEIKTNMKIVPVTTLSDAIDYLEQLPVAPTSDR